MLPLLHTYSCCRCDFGNVQAACLKRHNVLTHHLLCLEWCRSMLSEGALAPQSPFQQGPPTPWDWRTVSPQELMPSGAHPSSQPDGTSQALILTRSEEFAVNVLVKRLSSLTSLHRQLPLALSLQFLVSLKHLIRSRLFSVQLAPYHGI